MGLDKKFLDQRQDIRLLFMTDNRKRHLRDFLPIQSSTHHRIVAPPFSQNYFPCLNNSNEIASMFSWVLELRFLITISPVSQAAKIHWSIQQHCKNYISTSKISETVYLPLVIPFFTLFEDLSNTKWDRKEITSRVWIQEFRLLVFINLH